MPLELSGKRVLIFVVAYNAEKTIESVLDRIPEELRTTNVEVLIIDDSSKDATFHTGLKREDTTSDFKITILRNPENQGYGGNQKLGYRYAIDNGFDIVALIHGDGQYAPEKLPVLLEPFIRGEADAVFGSRMIKKKDALEGGMPLYKWVGNQVLTAFQNRMLGSRLSEFHSGYRLYSTKALAQIPFERNSNDFHFDTDIIVQLHFAGLRIVEIPIPTFYGDEICHVNGLKYAWDIFKTMLRAKFHEKNLLYDRKFDVGQVELTYDLKLGFASSHTMAIDAVKPGARVLDIGCGQGYVAAELAKRAGEVTGIDQYVPAAAPAANVQLTRWDLDVHDFPVPVSSFDQIFMLDIIEHLHDPEAFMETLRSATGRKRPEIVLTTANIGFAITRFALFLGEFNYGRKGILDRTHTRLFTFRSLNELFAQTGYKVLEERGIPAPFPKAVGDNALGRFLVAMNNVLIKLRPGLFSYQIFIRAQALPTVPALLTETIDRSTEMKKAAALAS
ncbi:MAG TPA: bifunctional glycosyltransferase/class I SAM-dependent methyltransferase [Chthoniobacteraceae bacterium]|nr:bifunctional glycosyltransferase/class I SAM-dependent methyltransferase [Chthoniobacteraceae bacterium]